MGKSPEQYIQEEFGHLVGLTIAEVRAMSKAEAEAFGWEINTWNTPPMVIIFTNGDFIVPSSDPEGNEAGHLFYESHKGD